MIWPFFDPYWLLLVLPAMLFALWAQSRVQNAFRRYARVGVSSRLTGAEAARALLQQAGLGDVTVDRLPTHSLGDHYDPRGRILRLSADVYDGASLAAVGVAAHEVGHAVQHAQGYSPLYLRNAVVPVANLGSQLAWPLFLLGFFFNSGFMMDAGILLFSLAVAFALITLPVELNASGRATEMLLSTGIVNDYEVKPVRDVLGAAALTYVAAATVAIAELLRLLMLRSRRD